MEDDIFILQGYGKSSSEGAQTRTPTEASEGIQNVVYDGPGTPSLGVSNTQIEVLDLVSEGPINGPKSGDYVNSGILGNIGWTTSTFRPYAIHPTTNINWWRSVYYNEVPVVGPNNKFNFQQIFLNWTRGRPNGTTTQRVKTTLTATKVKGERLRGSPTPSDETYAKIYRVLNKEIRAIEVNVKVGSLSQTNVTSENYGDVEITRVDYFIKFKPIFSNNAKTPKAYYHGATDAIIGKISNGLIKNTRIQLVNPSTNQFTKDPDFIGWELKIVRTTPDSITSTVRNVTYIDSLTEVYGDIFSYPNSSIFANKFSAEYFSQIPNRAYHLLGLKVKIPSNYDPITRTYTEGAQGWDGTFAEEKQYTNNPAWCFCDLITNKRYGLGKYVNSAQVDKWTLYEIAKYCDTLVEDGYGGLEPRFQCNLYINNRDEAFEVINQMASVFRGMTYYGVGSIFVSQDSPKTPIFLFNNSNVKEGEFHYESSSKRVRHTVAIVRYNDKGDFYKPAIEYVQDDDGIRRYGIRELEIGAIGCTSKGQALRLGRWALLTENKETETVTFTAGLEGSYLKPGDVFKTFDANRRDVRLGGRIYSIVNSASNCQVVLDAPITGLTNTTNYDFSLLTPTYQYDPTQVSDLTSSESSGIRRNFLQRKNFAGSLLSGYTGADGVARSSITFTTPFDATNYNISGNYPFTIEATGSNEVFGAQYDYWRAIKIEEKDLYQFTISALQYSAAKYPQIESGLAFEQPNYLAAPTSPTSIQLTVTQPTQNSKVVNYTINTPSIDKVSNFYIYAKKGAFIAGDFDDNDYLANTLARTELTGTYLPAEDGTYYFRAYSVNGQGVKSAGYAENSVGISNVNPISDITISSLRLAGTSGYNSPGIRSSGFYTASAPNFVWQAGFNSIENVPSQLSYRVSFREPSPNNTPSTHIYFEQTGVNGNSPASLQYQFTMENNIAAISNRGVRGPFRSYDVVVEAMDSGNNSSAGGYIGANLDSKFTNSNGYDILFVNNSGISDFSLTSGVCSPSDPVCTEQWLTTDGDVKINFTRGYTSDLAGAYLYSCNQPFTKGEAYGLTPTSKVIARTQAINVLNPLTIPANITGSSAYIALSLYDFFDEAVLNNNGGVSTGLYLSNVVKVSNRGLTSDQQAVQFSRWVYVGITGGNISNNWNLTNFGFSTIRSVSYSETVPATYGVERRQNVTANRFDNTYSWAFVDVPEHIENKFKTELYFTNPESKPYAVVSRAQVQRFTDKIVINGASGEYFFGIVKSQ